MSDYREYENGVADVLASVVGDDATVRRNVHLPGRRSGVDRQIDVVVKGRVFGVSDAVMILDCKSWASDVDVADMGSFIDLATDVGADFAVLMASGGVTPAARQRARNERGIRVANLTLAQLKAWRPAGTFGQEIALRQGDEEPLVRALRKKGYRVSPATSGDSRVTSEQAAIEVSRHFGSTNPSAEDQGAALTEARDMAISLGIAIVRLSHGIVVQGGTPQHRWLQTRYSGHALAKILAANEEEIASGVQSVSDATGIPADQIAVDRPEGWPFSPFAF